MDDEVRALERATGAGDLESAQRLALTLERAGRADDVIPALLRGRAHPAIRREIGARWDRLYLPDSRFVDVPAIQRPRVRWLTKLDGRDQVHTLLAHPLGVVAATKNRTIVLDPETGAPRGLPAARCPVLAGDVLLLYRSNRAFEGYDLVTGELLHSTRLVGATHDVSCGGGLLLTEARTYRLQTPHEPPTPAWTPEGQVVSLTRSRVFVRTGSGLRAFAHDGTRCWSSDLPGWGGTSGVTDDDLVILDPRPGLGTGADGETAPALGSADGTVRWHRAPIGPAIAITETVVVVAVTQDIEFFMPPQVRAQYAPVDRWLEVETLDRATGAPRARMLEDGFIGLHGTAIARDVLYAVVGTSRSAPIISARRLDGERLWQLGHKELEKNAAHSLAAAPGRLYAAGNRFVACIEEAATA